MCGLWLGTPAALAQKKDHVHFIQESGKTSEKLHCTNLTSPKQRNDTLSNTGQPGLVLAPNGELLLALRAVGCLTPDMPTLPGLPQPGHKAGCWCCPFWGHKNASQLSRLAGPAWWCFQSNWGANHPEGLSNTLLWVRLSLLVWLWLSRKLPLQRSLEDTPWTKQPEITSPIVQWTHWKISDVIGDFLHSTQLLESKNAPWNSDCVSLLNSASTSCEYCKIGHGCSTYTIGTSKSCIWECCVHLQQTTECTQILGIFDVKGRS